MAVELEAEDAGLGSFHVHRTHAFAGFELREDMLAALCDCGVTLDVATAVLVPCPDCGGAGACLRCAGSGAVVDHAALAWHLPATT